MIIEKQLTVNLLLISCFLVSSLAASARDGFNVYKDILRAKLDDDELLEMFSDDGISDKVYFYRAPVSAYANLAETFGKRTVNKFKNIMLTKDIDSEEPAEIEKDIVNRFYFPRTTKRGAILSWALPAANRVREMNINSYNPPGFNRPAAA